MPHTLIGGRVLDPVSGMDAVANVSFGDDGIITAIGAQKEGILVDVAGCWVMPGLVDIAAFAGEAGGDGADGLAATAQAALTGGYTTVLLSPSVAGGGPRIDHPAMVQALRSRARLVPVRMGIIGAATRGRHGGERDQSDISDIAGMVRAGAAAIGNVGYRELPVAQTALARRALENAKTAGVVALCVPLDASLRERGVATEGAIATRLGHRPDPAASEHVALARDLELVALAETAMVALGVSTQRSVDMVRAAKSRGLRVHAAAPLHHLLLDEMALVAHPYDTNYRFDPPLRARKDVQALVLGLATSDIDFVFSGHAPLGQLAKEPEFEDAEPGALGLQTCLTLLLQLVAAGTLPLLRAIDAVTSAPARSLGGMLAPGTGRLQPGAAADICVFDPAERWVVDAHHVGSWAANTPYWHQTLQGRVAMTLVGGVPHFDSNTRWRVS